MKTELKITLQGQPIINSATVVFENKDVVLIEIDMKTKWCQILSYGAGVYNGSQYPTICIETTPRSVHCGSSAIALTEIYFIGCSGFDVWCADMARYSGMLVRYKPDLLEKLR